MGKTGKNPVLEISLQISRKEELKVTVEYC